MHSESQRQVEHVKSPQINPRSKQIVESKYGRLPPKKVENRLYEDHLKRQKTAKMKEKMNQLKVEEMAHPNIYHGNPSTTFNSAQSLSSANGKEVMSRLMEYQGRYLESSSQLKSKHEDQE